MQLYYIMSHKTLPSRLPCSSCDLCTCNVWCCYLQRFRRRCIYKKMHSLTLTSRSHEALPSSLYVQQFRRRCIYEKYIIWPWPWGQSHTKRFPVSTSSCHIPTCKVWSCYFQWLRTDWCMDASTDFGTKSNYSKENTYTCILASS